MHRLLPILLLLCSSLLVAADNEPQYKGCASNTNYTRDGAFQANLSALLSSLPTAMSASSGFAENATGAAPPDQAFGLAQCCADVNASDCRACLDSLVGDMASDINCSVQKNAIFIYDRCKLRHSNASFFGDVDTSVVFTAWNAQNATQPERFTSQLGSLMGSLRTKAAYETPRMFAVGTATVTPLVNIYGMAQCSRNVAPGDCNRCLVGAVNYIPTCCDGKQGGRVISWSCSIRFEVEPFYDILAAEAAMMSPAPAPGSVSGNNHTARTALLVSIPVAVALVVVLLVAVFLCKKNRKPHKQVQIASAKGYADDEEMRSSESLLYDLSSLRAATNNFSEENKLGEGGFGPVYKGTLLNGEGCSEEIGSNVAARTGGDEERGFPVGKAPAQKLGATAWMLHRGAREAPRLRVPHQQQPRQNPFRCYIQTNMYNATTVISLHGIPFAKKFCKLNSQILLGSKSWAGE
ncbi:unnamed protein product [Urochloa humidicola]